MRPDTWFWAHDARPDQLDSLATPGQRLVRLSHYGSGRYAALFHGGAPTGCRIGLDAASAVACTDAVAITVDDRARFAVVTEPGAGTVIHVDLDAAELRTAVGEVVDIATYTLAGARRYAVILRRGAAQTRLLPDVSLRAIAAEADKRGIAVVRLRGHAGEDTFTAVLAPGNARHYADLDADAVADRLERHRAYPLDLDAVQTPDGPRFTLVSASE